jgi:hypothetical protein
MGIAIFTHEINYGVQKIFHVLLGLIVLILQMHSVQGDYVRGSFHLSIFFGCLF